MSIAKEERALLSIDHGGVHSPYQELPLPKGVEVVREKQLTFDPAGGNSSLTKIQFQTEKEVVTYQWQLGMEKLKNRRLPASLLLEGLIALAMFGVLTTLVLGELGDSRQQRLEELRQGEVLRVAKWRSRPGRIN